MKTVLIIAGSDPSAGAGIQQDLKVVTLLGAYGVTVVTALTVQNTVGVREVHPVDPDLVAAQLEAIFTDIKIDAVKVGMLATAAITRVVAARLRQATFPVVVDPVLAASDGSPLLEKAGLKILKEEILPLTTVFTPNLAEAGQLTGREVNTIADMETAARELGGMGARHVLVKGGHLPGKPVDVLWDGRNSYHMTGERLDGSNTHGTGCALAAALATHLAQGQTLPEAVNQARELVAEAIRWGLPLGHGRGPVNPAAQFLREQDRYSVLLSLAAAASRLQQSGVEELIPEVQSNLGYATLFPRGPQDVAAFPGRLLQSPQGLIIPREPAFGASRHIAAIILTVGKVFPHLRAAMNIRFLPEVEKLATALHLKAVSFECAQEPPEVKAREGESLAWGVAAVLQPGETPADLIWDRGDWGKEPMIRVLGTDPMNVVEKILAINQVLQVKQ
jgi:hydroxymethylpyrimidine kinase / phosphomethylpyrimidine kinase / thiamine-phosphate diphosphorylase